MATGDEWKGEEEGGGMYYSLFGGRPLTAEEKEAAKRHHAHVKAKGDTLGALLPAFNPARPCPKCGHNKVKMQHCSGAETYTSAVCYEQTGNHEHMHRTCKRCYYGWYEKPLGEGDA